MTRGPRQSEKGYALIFVFAMSAMLAMMLYLELPRLALEMQRNKEEMLIERGEQYARAIKVYAKKNKRYPQTIEELENTNGVRFLRRRYADPMTGKDEWRLIHADGSGRLTDSLVQKQPVPGQTQPEEKKSTNTFVSEGPAVGSTGQEMNERVAQTFRRRASEQARAAGLPPQPGDVSQQVVDPIAQQQQQYQQQYQQQQTVVPIMGPNGQPIQRIPGLPGQFGAGGAYPQQAANSQTGGMAGQSTANSGGYSFGSGYSGSGAPPPPSGPQPMQPVQAGGLQPGGGSNSFTPPLSGVPVPGGMPGGIAVNPATQMIQQILTRPNPQGLANIQGMQAGGQAMGGGIAGVASKHDAEGIKIYKDKTNYKEWEFVYDPSKDQKNAQSQMPGQMPGQIPGQNQPAGMGSSTGQGGFGSQQGGFGGQTPTRR